MIDLTWVLLMNVVDLVVGRVVGYGFGIGVGDEVYSGVVGEVGKLFELEVVVDFVSINISKIKLI